MSDIAIFLRWTRVILFAALIAVWIPFAALVLAPIMHQLRSSPKALAKAEYRYRCRHRHWDGYEPVWWANKPR